MAPASVNRDITPERRELEKALRNSRRSLPINLLFACLSLAVLWAARQYAGLPLAAALFLGFFGVFGALGDALNIPYVKRRLRKLSKRAYSESVREWEARRRYGELSPEVLAGIPDDLLEQTIVDFFLNFRV